MATFPAGLPKPVLDGYQLNPMDQTARTDMEMGMARVRRRSAARQDMVTLSWKFTSSEMNTFRTWFDNPAECAGGSSWFTITLAVGNGLESKEGRFVGPWKSQALPGLKFQVTATLEVR